jgi:hypothetical protein
MKPLASPALTRPFVDTTTPTAARAWPLRAAAVEPEPPRRVEPRPGASEPSEAAKRHIDQLAAHLRILQTSGAANPAMAAMLAYEMRAALGAYAAAGAVAPPVVGLEGLQARAEASVQRRVSVVV